MSFLFSGPINWFYLLGSISLYTNDFSVSQFLEHKIMITLMAQKRKLTKFFNFGMLKRTVVRRFPSIKG